MSLESTIAFKRIADCITDINIQELTKKENRIAKILEEMKIITKKLEERETIYIMVQAGVEAPIEIRQRDT